jgi:septum formation protein
MSDDRAAFLLSMVKRAAPPPPLVLASASPRRASLLEEAGYQFIVCPPDPSVEAEFESASAAQLLVVELALAKAEAIADQFDNAVILAADTVAECEGEILGKPRDREHAAEILTALSGKNHYVLTGVALIRMPGWQTVTRMEQTLLTMAPLSNGQIESYLDSGQWRGKAGAFGYQDGLDWVRITRGLASNVVGLPVERLPGMLRQLGVTYHGV